MIEWLKNLELEFIIIFAVLTVIVLVVIILLVKAQRTLNLIGKRALILTEDLVKRDGLDVVDMMIANTSYVNVEAASMGLIYNKKVLPLREENTIVLARDSFKMNITLTELRAYTLGDDTKLKKMYVYVEDSLGRRSLRKAKNSMRALKKILKQEKIEATKEEKRVRFETGQYNFFERLGLVFKVIFSPFTKLSKAIKKSTNRRLKMREERLVFKKIEEAHQLEMKEIAEEERREEERSNLEKKLYEERKNANIEARKAALARKELARKQQEELKKAEEELKREEAEAIQKEAEKKIQSDSNLELEKKKKDKEKEKDRTDNSSNELEVIEEKNIEINEENETEKEENEAK